MGGIVGERYTAEGKPHDLNFTFVIGNRPFARKQKKNGAAYLSKRKHCYEAQLQANSLLLTIEQTCVVAQISITSRPFLLQYDSIQPTTFGCLVPHISFSNIPALQSQKDASGQHEH